MKDKIKTVRITEKEGHIFVDFYFDGCPLRPFESSDFRNGSRKRAVLEHIENIITEWNLSRE